MQVVQHQGYFLTLPACRAGDALKVVFADGKRRQILEVWPRLNASRQILQSVGVGKKRPFLLVCPHIADGLATELSAKGINHADLNGRLYIRTEWFLLDRSPKRISYRNSEPNVNPFTLKSSRVIRAFLSRREHEWSQEELQIRTSISRPLVSLTLAELIERELVAQTRPGNRHAAALYRVKDFDRLLDAWGAADDWSKRTTIEQYSVLAGDFVRVAETAQAKLGPEHVFFTQWFAAHLRRPHTTPPLVSAYVKRSTFDPITWARRVDNGGNLWLITPRDEGVFQEAQTMQGFNLVADAQIYLDLLKMGQRGPEQAEELRGWEGFSK